MSNPPATRNLFLLITAAGLLVRASAFATPFSDIERPNPVITGLPKVSWSVTNFAPVVTVDGSITQSVTFASNQKLTGLTFGIPSEIAPYLKIYPPVFDIVPANTTQAVSFVFAAPAKSALGTYKGLVLLHRTNGKLPVELNVTMVVTSNRVSLVLPPLFKLNDEIGSTTNVSLNNFNNEYSHGGMPPAGGAEIDAASAVLPPPPLLDYISTELQGATLSLTTNIYIGTNSATEVFYTDDYAPSVTTKNVAVYAPISGRLYKLFLSYRADDPAESQYLSDFEQVLGSIQFSP